MLGQLCTSIQALSSTIYWIFVSCGVDIGSQQTWLRPRFSTFLMVWSSCTYKLLPAIVQNGLVNLGVKSVIWHFTSVYWCSEFQALKLSYFILKDGNFSQVFAFLISVDMFTCHYIGVSRRGYCFQLPRNDMLNTLWHEAAIVNCLCLLGQSVLDT